MAITSWSIMLLLMGGILMAAPLQAKERSLTVTAAQRANAVRNAGRYEWARQERDAVVAAAARWRAMSDEELWALVPSQELPRSIHVFNVYGTNRIALCPQCGEGIIPFGNYPWRTDVFARPWKIECPKCRGVFPKNDFGAYYRSALDEHGFFRRGKGDPKLLFNAEHPDPADPLHKAFVDDGYGWTEPAHPSPPSAGPTTPPLHHSTTPPPQRWDFVAVYVQWGLWKELIRGTSSLARAYTLTDDPVYARKCGVLLARMADVYPEMDWHPLFRQGFSHSDGGSGKGRVEGRIWETGNARGWALAYDQIYDALARDADLAAFVDRMHRAQALAPVPDPRALTAHVERGLIREIIQGVKDGRIRGNEGMYHSTLIAAAIALDDPVETPQLLDWVFAPGEEVRDGAPPGRSIITGGNLANVVTGVMDRDGLGNEGAPGYSLWGASLQSAADLLEENPKYRARSLYRDFPNYRQYYHACWRWSCLDAATPPIGDSGAASAWGRATAGAATILNAFRIYRDPALARHAWQLLGRKLDGVRGSIFDEDPEALRRDVEAVVAGPEPPLAGRFLDGWGLAILQAPQRENGRALWLYFGRNTGHGHKDRLNLGLYAENLDMLPDLGYPEYASGRPKDLAWCRNNASHNTVTVDGAAQSSSYTGRLLAFEPEGKARLVDASSDGIYPGATTCRRTAWMVDVDDRRSYVVDLFRVRGGGTHTLSWHGPPGPVTPAGLSLQPQGKGTYAGPDVPFEALAPNWREKAGFSFLYNVERDRKPPESFTVDYRATDTRGRIAEGREPHLRLHNLTPLDEAALADGDPPQNKANAPRRMRYLLATREAPEPAQPGAISTRPASPTADARPLTPSPVHPLTPSPVHPLTPAPLDSLFVTVLEPYDRAPFIGRVRRLAVLNAAPGTHPAAVEVTLPDGRVDVIVSCEEAGRVVVEGDIVVDGAHAFLSRRNGKVECARLSEGTLLSCGAFRLTAGRAAYTGTIARLLPDDPNDQQIEMSAALPLPEAQSGRTLFVRNEGPQDAAYTLAGPPAGSRVSVGAISLARGYVDPKEPAKGLRYNIAPGDPYRIPTFVYLDLPAGLRHANTPFTVEGE